MTLTLGRFFDWGRAEALLFFAWRPWLLIAAAALAAPLRWRQRLAFYLCALLLAGFCESLLLMRLGAANPWPEMARGVAAGAMLLVPLDILAQLGRRWRGKGGVVAAAAAAALLMLVPGLREPYDKVAIGKGDGAPARERPRLLLMTSLPIVWGEQGPFQPGWRPASAYRALQEEYDVRPIDVLDEKSLGSSRLLLLAQPRWLAPHELVALDGWVRRGGRAVILADPLLAWPSELPLGDVRRPAPTNLLGPLLLHWDLELLPPRDPGPQPLRLEGNSSSARRKLVMDSPGRFAGGGQACRVHPPAFARCRIGKGKVVLLADADLMRDDLWAAPGDQGASRHRRLGDNPLVVADLLDEVSSLRRERVRRPVAWMDPDTAPGPAAVAAFLPLILLTGGGFLLALMKRTKSQRYPQGYKERT